MYRIKEFVADNYGKQTLYRIQKRKKFLGIIPYWTEVASTSNTWKAYPNKEAAEDALKLFEEQKDLGGKK